MKYFLIILIIIYTAIGDVCAKTSGDATHRGSENSNTSGEKIKSAKELSKWMTDNKEKIKHKRIRDLKLPGSHDSGAYEFLDKKKSADGRTPPLIGGKIIKPWAKTQNLNLENQLNVGIRAFDLRVSFEKDGDFYLSHGLRANKLRDELKVIDNFLKHNPGELVILKTKALSRKIVEKHNKENNLNEGLANILITELKNRVLKRSETGKELLANITVDTILNLKKNIILIWDAKNEFNEKEEREFFREKDYLFSGEMNLVSNAPLKSDPKQLAKAWSKKVEKGEAVNDKMWILHYTLTANFGHIATHALHGSVENMTKSLKKKEKLSDMLEKMKDSNINIVMMDFPTPDDCKTIIALNGIDFQSIRSSPVRE
jgi:hypothetical protein